MRWVRQWIGPSVMVKLSLRFINITSIAVGSDAVPATAGTAGAKAEVHQSAKPAVGCAIHVPAAGGGITIAVSKQLNGNLYLSVRTKFRHQRIFVLRVAKCNRGWPVTARLPLAAELQIFGHCRSSMAGSQFQRFLWADLDAVTAGDTAQSVNRSLAKQTRAGFQRFWNESAGYCFDVLDGPDGHDASLRPNQIFAVALPESPLSAEQQRAVVDTCSRHLLTSHGLRSLGPSDPHYHGHYGGGPLARDAAYHQGTVWGWLLGPFVRAHLRVYRDVASAAQFLKPMAHHLKVHGLGSASEIFDGDPPFTPRGCIAQAWTVAELLDTWQQTLAGAE